MRVRKKADKILAVSSLGSILSCKIEFPTKNVFSKVRKEPYKAVNREKYREYSKIVANKVSHIRELEIKSKQLSKMVTKNSWRTIANSFDKILANCKED